MLFQKILKNGMIKHWSQYPYQNIFEKVGKPASCLKNFKRTLFISQLFDSTTVYIENWFSQLDSIVSNSILFYKSSTNWHSKGKKYVPTCHKKTSQNFSVRLELSNWIGQKLPYGWKFFGSLEVTTYRKVVSQLLHF